MTAHSDREHAAWSASASHRNFACPGALALTKDLPNRTSQAADWGTVVHEIQEICLREDRDASDFIGEARKGKEFCFDVDEEMAECAQEFVDYVRGRLRAYKAETGGDAVLWLEERFSLAALNPPIEAGGTGDAVIYFPEWAALEIVDQKTGRGVVVEVDGNEQLLTYALGALLAHPGLHVDTVLSTIVQPRAPHRDGRTRTAEIDVASLLDWTSLMLDAMRRSAQALADREKIVGDLTEAEWAAAHLRPGPHCGDTFCGAQAICPAVRKRALETYFEPLGNPPRPNAPDSGSPDERAARLDMLDEIESWVKAVRAHEHRMAEAGSPATGYGLVRKVGREKWIDEDAAALVLDMYGLAEKAFRNPGKLRTPKQVRDALTKAKMDQSLTAGLSETPEGGTNLVRLSKSDRPEVSPTANKFTPIEED